MELLHFIFSSPYIFFGTAFLILIIGSTIEDIIIAARGNSSKSKGEE